MKPMNIYLCGVGGQGIGLLAEIMIQSCLKAGHNVKGVDTHGLAQRGGIVFSNIRLGEGVYTPMIAPGEADLILGMERLEAYRGVVSMLREGGSVVYYDCEYQPIHVRMGKAPYPSVEDLNTAVQKRHGFVQRVRIDNLPDPRMQNVALLGRIATMGVIEGLTQQIVEQSLHEVLPEAVMQANLDVLHSAELKAQSGQ